MALNCDACGLKDSEVKSGGGIEPKGRRIRLKLTDVTDLSRDVLRVSKIFFLYAFRIVQNWCSFNEGGAFSCSLKCVT